MTMADQSRVPSWPYLVAIGVSADGIGMRPSAAAGTAGLHVIKASGDQTIVQDLAEVSFPSMLAAAIAVDGIDLKLRLGEIGTALVGLVRRGPRPPSRHSNVRHTRNALTRA